MMRRKLLWSNVYDSAMAFRFPTLQKAVEMSTSGC